MEITLVVSKHSNCQGKYSSKLLQVYVPTDDRPFDNGNIAGDFAWRRNHDAPNHLKPVIKEAIIEVLALRNHTIDEVTITYDRCCGCSMCPCSPGFVVRSKKDRTTTRTNVWLEWPKAKGEIVLDKKTNQYELVV